MKNENGEEYKPSSLTYYQRSFQRYFTEKKLPFNIFEDEEFSRCRQVLAAKLFGTGDSICMVTFFKHSQATGLRT